MGQRDVISLPLVSFRTRGIWITKRRMTYSTSSYGSGRPRFRLITEGNVPDSYTASGADGHVGHARCDRYRRGTPRVSGDGGGERCGSELTPPAAVLAEMFEEIRTVISDEWMAFRALVHILRDATRLHPLEPALRSVANKVSRLLRPYATALEGEDQPFDPLGEVFTYFEIADCDNNGGQVLTPRWICEYINDRIVGKGLQDIASGEREMDCPMIMLDPLAGTGRFAIAIAQRYGNLQQDAHSMQVYAVEENIWLYRACFANLRLLACLEPNFVLWGDSLLLDLGPPSPNWLVANRRHAVDWRELPPVRTATDEGHFDLQALSLACSGSEPARTEYVSLDACEERTGAIISSVKPVQRET